MDELSLVFGILVFTFIYAFVIQKSVIEYHKFLARSSSEKLIRNLILFMIFTILLIFMIKGYVYQNTFDVLNLLAGFLSAALLFILVLLLISLIQITIYIIQNKKNLKTGFSLSNCRISFKQLMTAINRHHVEYIEYALCIFVAAVVMIAGLTNYFIYIMSNLLTSSAGVNADKITYATHSISELVIALLMIGVCVTAHQLLKLLFVTSEKEPVNLRLEKIKQKLR